MLNMEGKYRINYIESPRKYILRSSHVCQLHNDSTTAKSNSKFFSVSVFQEMSLSIQAFDQQRELTINNQREWKQTKIFPF